MDCARRSPGKTTEDPGSIPGTSTSMDGRARGGRGPSLVSVFSGGRTPRPPPGRASPPGPPSGLRPWFGLGAHGLRPFALGFALHDRGFAPCPLASLLGPGLRGSAPSPLWLGASPLAPAPLLLVGRCSGFALSRVSGFARGCSLLVPGSRLLRFAFWAPPPALLPRARVLPSAPFAPRALASFPALRLAFLGSAPHRFPSLPGGSPVGLRLGGGMLGFSCRSLWGLCWVWLGDYEGLWGASLWVISLGVSCCGSTNGCGFPVGLGRGCPCRK